MPFIRCARDGELLVATLGRGKANAIDAALLEELWATVEVAASDAAVRGLVLGSDQPRFFSSGFDLTEVFGLDRPAMRAFFGRFVELYERLCALPKPVVAAVAGHAYAGGAVLALAADVRIMADGDFGFALNEVNLGLALPDGFVRRAVATVGVPAARDLLLAGRTLSPEEAHAIGLVDELAPPEAVLERALERCRELAEKPAGAFGAMKRSVLAATRQDESDRGRLEAFLDQWFSPEALERKEALVRSLRR